MSTTPNMNLVLPDVSSTVGPTWATLLNAAYSLIDSHDHSSGNGVRITPTGLNISSDLTFAQNNATNLRTARLYNNSAITLGVNDKTCLYSLNNELYYVDGNGNNVQVTLNGALDISANITSLTLNDTSFIIQYFGDTTRKFRFNASAIPTGTTRVITMPDSGGNDTLVTAAATQTLTNKTLTSAVLSGGTAVTLISGSGTLILPTTGTVTIPNGTDTLVNLTGTQTLTGKILTGNNIASFTPDGGTHTITVPAVTDTLVALAASQTLTNKVLTGNTAVNLISGSGTTVLNTTGTITVPNGTDTLVGKATTDTLTNKTLTTPKMTSIVNGSYTIVLPTTDGSGGQVVTTDGSGNWAFSTVATTVGNVAANDSNVVFTNSDNRHQICNPTANRTYTLPTTSIPTGDTWDFDNRSAFLITLNSSGGNLVGYVPAKSKTRVEAVISTPTTAANWNFPTSATIFDSTDVSKQILFTASGNTTGIITTIASTSTTAKTITLPNATDTLVGKATTDILTNKTMTAPILNMPVGGVAPATGQIGEQLISTVTSGAFATTGTYGNATSLTLSAGCWDVSCLVNAFANGATIAGYFSIGISTSSTAGTFADASPGVNQALCTAPSGTTNARYATGVIPQYRVNISTPTTYYLKAQIEVYSVATPQYNAASLKATRVG